MHRARRTVAVYSPKGGVGTTTIAANIAIAAVADRPDRVVLVDLALQFGGVATLLNLDPKQTHRRRRPRRVGARASRSCCGPTRCATTAASTSSPPRPRPKPPQTDHPGARRADPVGRCSRATTWSSSTPGRRSTSGPSTIFEAAETVILPVTPEIAALKAMHALLEYLAEAGTISLKSR